ncbi:MAG: AMP-binding protein [Candidatus Marinarcus sp.]|uniref:AMP-binding protein n=1 Tax=Candidatus Marinarcus sp. TaxID=3100987 RepID=UPI003AFF90EF
MQLIVYNDDATINYHCLDKENLEDKKLKNHIGFIGSHSKEENTLNIIQAYHSNSKAILFDYTNQPIVKKLHALGIPKFKENFEQKTVFDEQDFSMMFFTSGSTGESVGALKTKAHLEEEVKVLSEMFAKHNIKRVIVTVPFIHIYGTLFGLLYPLLNNIDIILKEHFLPHDLLDLIDENSLIVTTPLYIKALNKISQSKDLSQCVFVSSTGPLDALSAKEFSQKFNTQVMQIFGSTETGGIAYKYNDDELWTPMKKVEISTNEQSELKIKSPFVSDVLYENGFKNIHGEIQTFDYVEIKNKQFKLVGRSSQILKIAGKRYSTIQIEHILEEIKDITKAMVFVDKEENSLRGETLNITLETSHTFTTKEIKKILQENLSNLKFSIKLHLVEKIPTSSVGKKLKIM